MRDLIAEMMGAEPIGRQNGTRDLIAEMGGEIPAPPPVESSWWDKVTPYLSDIGAGFQEEAKAQGAAGRIAAATAGSLAIAPAAGVAGLAKTITSGVNEGGKTLEGISSLPGRLIQSPEEAYIMENTVGNLMKPFQMAGEGLIEIVRLTPLRDTIAEPIAGTIGEISALFGLPGVPKTAKSWWNSLPYRKRLMVVDQVKADIANGEFTGAELREMWKDPENRDALLKRYQGVGDEKPTGPTMRASGADVQGELPPGQGFEMRPRPGEVRDILAEMGEGPKTLPSGQGFELRPRPEEVRDILAEMQNETKQIGLEPGTGEGFTSVPGTPEAPIVTKAGEPFKSEQTALRTKDLDWNLYEVTPQGEGFAITRKMGREIKEQGQPPRMILRNGELVEEGTPLPKSTPASPLPEGEIVQPGESSIAVQRKQSAAEGVIGRINQLGGLNVYDDYNAPEMRQFPDMVRVMKKAGLKPDDLADQLNGEGYNVGSGDDLLELLKTGGARNVFTPGRVESIIERKLRGQENEWIESQLANLEARPDPIEISKVAGDLKASLHNEIKAEGFDILDEKAALKEINSFFDEVAAPTLKGDVQLDLAPELSAANTFDLTNPETEIFQGDISRKDMTPSENLDIISSMTSPKGTANIPPETTPKAVGGNPFKDSILQEPVFHGTPKGKLKEFAASRFKGTPVYFFTENKGLARQFAENKFNDIEKFKAGNTPVVIEAYLDIKNIFDPKKDGARLATEYVKQGGKLTSEFDVPQSVIIETIGDGYWRSIENNEGFIKFIKDKGYDGFVTGEPMIRGQKYIRTYGVFSPDQIKILPNPSRSPEGKGPIGSERGSTGPVNESEILSAILSARGKIDQAMPHIEALGRSVYESGKTRFLDWQAAIKARLGDLWENFKGYLRGVYDRLQSGEVGPLGNQKGAVGKDIAGKTVKEGREVLTEIKQTADEYMGAISTRLGNIDPSLKYTLRNFEFKRGTRAAERTKRVLPFIEKANKIPAVDKEMFDLARKNGNPEALKKIVTKYGMGKEYHELRNVLQELHKEAVAVGYDVGYQPNYHPRVLKDTKGFLEYFYKRGDWPVIQKAIKERETQLQRYLSDDEKAKLINTMLRGYPSGQISLSKPGQLKAREIDKVTPELNQFYMDSNGALLRYISDVTDAIEARKLFGKGPKGGKVGNLDDTIGGYVLDLLQKGKIKPEQERVLRDILDARFNEVGTRGIFGLYKNLSYIDTMGSPISAVTQIGDLAWALYKSGPLQTATAAGKAIAGKSLFKKEDIGIERIASEFADTSKAARAVTKVFRMTGLEKIDNIGKEGLINSTYAKARQQAMTERGTAVLRKELEPIFEGETDQVLKDIRQGNITENVKLYLFNNLADFQPIALSEMPQKYLTGGNGRIFYMLKSFTLKQFDVYRREIFQKIAQEGTRLEGLKNLVYLTGAFVAANAGADFIKDLMLGRPIDIEDKVVDNMLRLLGISKFVTWKAREEGVGSAMVRQIAPPFKAADAISKDIAKVGDGEGLEITQSIPIVGKLYYWWFGKGAEKSARKSQGGSAGGRLVNPNLKGLKGTLKGGLK